MKSKLLPLLLLAAAPALAQSTKAKAPAKAPAATAAAAPAPAFSASHRQAAEAFLEASRMGASLGDLTEQMLQMQLQQRPEAKAFEPELRTFFTKYLSWESLRPDMVSLYAREFSEGELRDITAFYNTPTGQKMVTKLPVLMQAGMELSQRRVMEHMPELRQLIETRQKAGN